MVILWCIHVRFILFHSCILVHSCILCVLVNSCIILHCGMSCHSCGPLCHFLVRGRVKVGVVVIVAVALITFLAFILVRRSIGGIVCVIIGPVLSLEEWAPVSILDERAPGIAARKMVHTVDDILWEGEGSEDFGD